MHNIEQKFSTVFIGEGEFSKPLHLNVDDTVQPVKMPLRRVPLSLKLELKNRKINLRIMGQLRKLTTPLTGYLVR
jgi:hypothetical protein